MTKTAMLVAGAGGKMGRAVIGEILKTPGAALAGGFDRAGAPHLGKDLGALAGLDSIGLIVDADAGPGLARAGSLIDFTAPAASVANARAAAEVGVAHIIGTTGFSAAQEGEIRAAAARVPIVKSGNMSLGVNLLCALVEDAAGRLDDSFDIEIFEAHHREKVDAPSGTALMLGRAAARGRGVDLDEKAAGMANGGVGGRTGVRRVGDIGFSVFRGGGIVGDHRVSFAAMDEILTLSHTAIDRSLFARGAVVAAQWATGRAPGLYSMRDVLGI